MNAGYFRFRRSRSGDRVQPGQVKRPGQVVHGPAVDAQLGHELLEHLGGDRLLDLQPYRGLETPPEQFTLKRLHQVLRDVLVHLQVPGPGDPEHVMLEHVKADEQLGQVRRDHVFQRHEPVLAHGEEAGQQRRHLHPGEHGHAGVRVGHHDRQAEREARDVGERVRRVHDQRGEHRVDPVPEQCLQVLLLVGGKLLPAQDLDALRRQGGHDPAVEVLGVPQAELAGGVQGALKDQVGGQPLDVLHRQAGRHPPHPARHPDHEELVQVAREDGHEAHPLQQRKRLVLGEFEHPLVEPEPALLPVEIAIRRQFLAGCGVAGRTHLRSAPARAFWPAFGVGVPPRRPAPGARPPRPRPAGSPPDLRSCPHCPHRGLAQDSGGFTIILVQNESSATMGADRRLDPSGAWRPADALQWPPGPEA